MIPRLLSDKIRQLAGKMPVISITGPRQSGKTVLAQQLFPQYQYVNLENLEQRVFAQNDPSGFIRSFTGGVIIDEVQYAPDLFSYIQVRVDETRRNGEFVLTGSQNFQLSAHLSQSLAGRAVNAYLLPFSMEELEPAGWLPADYESLLFQGGYPRIYDQQVEPPDFYPSYIENYLERDIRQLIQVADLGKFQSFIRLCAARTGQLFNQSAIAVEAGVDANTVKRWLSILETSFIAFRLPPYFRNYNKRLLKTPKLYFYHTGLLCSLLGIRAPEQLHQHFLKGALFENFIIVETLKQFHHRGIRPLCYYWRDNTGNEIDLLIEDGARLFPVEIKSGRTIQPDFFKNLDFFHKISGNPPEQGWVIYGGQDRQARSNGTVRGWRDLPVWSTL
ncbi:MAG: ATP-binding protein [Saprospiraceae bacterium]|nr:ATP-binding protein [Saprospiraceae bacterium]